ncbi:hypothetical protein Tco_1487493, partial [Tanacetum coccineum]
YKVNAAEGVNAASEEVSTAELIKEFDLLKWDQQVVSQLISLRNFARRHGSSGEGSTMPTDPNTHPPLLNHLLNLKRLKNLESLRERTLRAATTASSLEAEQDNDNTTKTRYKATLNKFHSLRTTSSGGPRCQETMGDTISQTRFENISKHSNDSLLARGNTLRSDEDRIKLNELMELSKVESSDDQESLGKDASKQGRINAINADDDITLVSVHDMNVSADEEVGEKEVFDVINNAKLIIDAAQVSVAGDKVSTTGVATTVSAATTTADDLTLA